MQQSVTQRGNISSLRDLAKRDLPSMESAVPSQGVSTVATRVRYSHKDASCGRKYGAPGDAQGLTRSNARCCRHRTREIPKSQNAMVTSVAQVVPLHGVGDIWPSELLEARFDDAKDMEGSHEQGCRKTNFPVETLLLQVAHARSPPSVAEADLKVWRRSKLSNSVLFFCEGLPRPSFPNYMPLSSRTGRIGLINSRAATVGKPWKTGCCRTPRPPFFSRWH